MYAKMAEAAKNAPVGEPVDPKDLPKTESLPAEEKAKAAGRVTNEEAKGMSDEMKEVMKIARQAELAEEEAFMKQALAESEKQAAELKRQETEEEEMIRKAIEESEREEKARV